MKYKNIEKLMEKFRLKIVSNSDILITTTSSDDCLLKKIEYLDKYRKFNYMINELDIEFPKKNKIYYENMCYFWQEMGSNLKSFMPTLRPIQDLLDIFYTQRKTEYKYLIIFNGYDAEEQSLGPVPDIEKYERTGEFNERFKKELEDFDNFLIDKL